MLARYFDAGGPVMWAVFTAWVIVLAGVLDRALYALGRAWRRPVARVRALALGGRLPEAEAVLARERRAAARGLERIDAVSQLATSIGLFGTVLGLSYAFFVRGSGDLSLAAPEVLAKGLSTALFTTVGGLIVYLFGQAFLIAYSEWQAVCERRIEELLVEEAL